jgi:hypothetical protein
MTALKQTYLVFLLAEMHKIKYIDKLLLRQEVGAWLLLMLSDISVCVELNNKAMCTIYQTTQLGCL